MPGIISYEILNEPFSLVGFKKLLSDLVEHEFYNEEKNITCASDIIESVKNIGIFQGDRFHNILVIKHNAGVEARVKIATETFKLMSTNSIDAALVAYHSERNESWRISLITLKFQENKSGGITKTFSNPRRYSYVLGPTAKTVTPYKYLISKGISNNFDDLLSRFSIEVVNNEFYKEIAKLYDELIGTENIARKIVYPSDGDDSQEFAVRLIGRVIFCWFLREKKSKTGVALIPANVLSREASNQPDYYHNVLAPLFFEVLNRPLFKRTNKFQSGEYAHIPYLNGGLFNDDNVDHYKFDKNLELSVPGLVDVPDTWLHQLFDLLERFNFTVDENTSYDTDLSIDPEMLGRVFENLLARINPETGETVRKSTGSFYTPREIVEYMVDASLSEYLVSKTNIDKTKIEALVSYSLFDEVGKELSNDEKVSVLEALSTLTVLDPACGSGAFPIGMLQKIVFIISQLDHNAEWWLAKQLEGASPEMRREFTNKSVDYIRKLGIIRQTIFGVDIQLIATEISRLRCFLTLIVDEVVDDAQENRGIRPLPNLDFKFVTANSLITLPKPEDKKGQISETQAAMFEEISHIEELKKIRNEYFSSTNLERSELQSRFDRLQKKMVLTNVDVFHGSASKLYDTLSRWDPFEHTSCPWFDPEWMFGNDKFDIIIANPPYLGEKGHKELFRKIKEDGLEQFYAGRMDLFYFFFHNAINLCKINGITAFITTNYYPTATGAKKLRKDFYERTRVVELINFNELKIFESALGQHNMITILQRSDGTDSGSTKVIMNSLQGAATPNMLAEIVGGRAEGVLYSTCGKTRLYDGREFYIRFPHGNGGLDENGVDQLLDKVAEQSQELEKFCNVNQGIVSGADKFSDAHARKYPELNAKKGDGIFVFGVDTYDFTNLKPWFKNSDIKRYVTTLNNKTQALYLTPKSKPQEKELVYLSKFRPILDKRREVTNGRIPWWSLQWGRNEEIFNGPKIVAPQRSPRNTFGYNEAPWYTSADVYFITPKNHDVKLKYILGLLNSKLYYVWLYNRGKRKGETLELYQKPLSEIPIKQVSENQQTEIIEVVDQILQAKLNNPETNTKTEEKTIDSIVYKLYDLTPEEIQIIENSVK